MSRIHTHTKDGNYGNLKQKEIRPLLPLALFFLLTQTQAPSPFVFSPPAVILFFCLGFLLCVSMGYFFGFRDINYLIFFFNLIRNILRFSSLNQKRANSVVQSLRIQRCDLAQNLINRSTFRSG